jgi:hypothetical protein
MGGKINARAPHYMDDNRIHPKGTMSEVKRRHHFVPVFYLAGFTPSGSTDDRLSVLDLPTGKTWGARPSAIGFEKNLYAFDHPSADPNTVEDILSDRVEGPMAQIMASLSDQSLPLGPEDYETLMRFLAMLAIRVPRIRRREREDTRRVEQFATEMMMQHPASFQGLVEQLEREGVRLPEGADLEAMRQEVLANPPPLMDQNWHMETMLEIAEELVPVFGARSWSLLVAEEEAGDFICSDSPVAMMSTDPRRQRMPMGFGCEDVIVTAPLSRRMALFGKFGGHSIMMKVDRPMVAFINQRTAVFAERHLYASNLDFPIALRDGSVGAWSEYRAQRSSHREGTA